MSSSTSVSTPVSGHATTENESLSLADEVKKYDTEALIEYLQKQDLGLDEDDEKIIRKEKITGRDFFDLSQEELEQHGMKLGPAKRLVKFAKECKEKKLRSFSSYKTKKDLKELLAKYGIDGNGMDNIPLFELQTHSIQDGDEHYKHCIKEIMVRLKNYGTLVVDSLEAMRNEYVVSILHTAINIARDATEKDFSMRPECEIIGDESSGRVDYAIKESENFICVTEDKVEGRIIEGFAQNIAQLESSYETNKKKRKRGEDDFDYLYGIVTTARDWHFLLYTPGSISRGSETPLTIEFDKKVLDKNSSAHQSLCNSVKEVLSVVVGLLKDRGTCSDEEPDRKRTKIDSYRSKK